MKFTSSLMAGGLTLQAASGMYVVASTLLRDSWNDRAARFLVATLICLLALAFLIWREHRRQRNGS